MEHGRHVGDYFEPQKYGKGDDKYGLLVAIEEL
jgi:hypothetical protein